MYRQIRMVSATDNRSVEAIAVAMFKNPKPRVPAGYAELDDQLGGLLSQAIARPETLLEKGGLVTLYPGDGQAVSRKGTAAKRAKLKRVFIIGLGEEKSFTPEAIRVGSAKLVRAASAAGLRRVGLDLTTGLGDRLEAEPIGRAAGDGLAIGNFRYQAYQGQGQSDPKNPKPVDLTVQSDGACQKGLNRGLAIGESVNLARELAATPPNVANPRYLVDRCQRMARRVGLRCTVIDAKRAKQLKMHGLLAVGAAGSTPPALICLEHRPQSKSKKKNAKGTSSRGPITLVGKAVTFDTGGYSLKPSASMDGMKYDKCGGMAVIGAMHAVARLNLPQHVVGLIPTAENMVDEKAYRPGDILTMSNGVTVEVTNTDAEGRLILADSLAYAAKHYQPKAVVDLATLTGGVVVALGSVCAGLFCNQDKLRHTLLQAGDDSGERLWHLPLWDEHKKQMQGTHSDIVNSAGREAHPIQGAAFLSYFVDPKDFAALPKTPWAHIDIAGVSDVKDGKNPLFPDKGPTGFGVRLLVRALEQWGKA